MQKSFIDCYHILPITIEHLDMVKSYCTLHYIKNPPMIRLVYTYILPHEMLERPDSQLC